MAARKTAAPKKTTAYYYGDVDGAWFEGPYASEKDALEAVRTDLDLDPENLTGVSLYLRVGELSRTTTVTLKKD